MPHPRAFTLIELLVVITIIVVLLSLLAPAMDKAIYQAELVVCGTKQKTIGMTANTYAMGNKRYYFYRPGPRDPERGWEVYKIRDIYELDDSYDDRNLLGEYFNINKHFDEPLSDEIDMERVDIDSYIHAGFYLWFGFQYHVRSGGAQYEQTRVASNAASSSGMFKLGNRIRWTQDQDQDLNGPGQSGPVTYRLSLLASDYHVVASGNAYAWTNHPDAQGNVSAVSAQDAPVSPTDPNSVTGATGTFSRYEGPIQESTVDLNFAYADGSVQRFNAVEGFDERMAKVPHYNITTDRNYPNHYSQVPKE